MRGRPFEKGHKPLGGRKKGVPNNATLDFKEFWGKFFKSEDYRANLKGRLLAGKDVTWRVGRTSKRMRKSRYSTTPAAGRSTSGPPRFYGRRAGKANQGTGRVLTLRNTRAPHPQA